MAVTKIHRINTTLNLAIDYVTNGGKTQDGDFVTSFACSPEIACRQFIRKQEEAVNQGKALAHHLIQSFLPGEVTPEKAHEIGIQLADKFLDDKYQYIVATHIDKGHIHNHIIFNSVSFVTHRHYESYKKTYYQIRNLSDKLCADNGLYIIPPSPNRGQSYYEYTQAKQGTSYKARLKETIDRLIPFCKDYEDLLSKLEQKGYELKRGKYVSCRVSNQERFTRIKTLGNDYTKEALTKRIQEKSKPFPFKKEDRNKGRIIDIEGSEKIRSSAGLTRWAKLHNLKEAANMLIQIQQDFSSYDELSSHLEKANDSLETNRSRLVKIEDRMKHLSVMMEYIKTYHELKPLYMQYQKSKDKESFLRKNESDILIFESIGRQIKEMGYSKLPSFQTLKAEYDSLVSRKAELTKLYEADKSSVKELSAVKKNIEQYLSRGKEYINRKAKDELQIHENS